MRSFCATSWIGRTTEHRIRFEMGQIGVQAAGRAIRVFDRENVGLKAVQDRRARHQRRGLQAMGGHHASGVHLLHDEPRNRRSASDDSAGVVEADAIDNQTRRHLEWPERCRVGAGAEVEGKRADGQIELDQKR